MYTVKSSAVDMAEFNQMEEIEDYYLEDFFPKPLPEHIQPFIEHRIKLVLKESTIFVRGETEIVNTACVIKGKMKNKRGKLSMHIIPYENLPLTLESCGYIDGNFQGRIVVQLVNYSGDVRRFSSGTPVGYIIMQLYSRE